VESDAMLSEAMTIRM